LRYDSKWPAVTGAQRPVERFNNGSAVVMFRTANSGGLQLRAEQSVRLVTDKRKAPVVRALT